MTSNDDLTPATDAKKTTVTAKKVPAKPVYQKPMNYSDQHRKDPGMAPRGTRRSMGKR